MLLPLFPCVAFGIRDHVKKGKVAPFYCSWRYAGVWRLYKIFPKLKGRLFLRGLVYTVPTTLLLDGFVVGLLEIVCKANGDTCSMGGHTYAWVKGFFCGVIAALLYPPTFLAEMHSTDAGLQDMIIGDAPKDSRSDSFGTYTPVDSSSWA